MLRDHLQKIAYVYVLISYMFYPTYKGFVAIVWEVTNVFYSK